MKYLYVVDYWVPFPTSEYGGVLNVIASNDVECHDLLLDWRDEFVSKYDRDIMVAVNEAQIFQLANDETSAVISSFTT
jgi:hypothetical protein